MATIAVMDGLVSRTVAADSAPGEREEDVIHRTVQRSVIARFSAM